MISAIRGDLARRAEFIYESELKAKLEPEHRGKFITIEPESGRFFLGPTLDESASAAEAALPGHKMVVLRVGYPAAVEVGYSL